MSKASTASFFTKPLIRGYRGSTDGVRPIAWFARMRWPVDETGRYSVRPWIAPRIAAWRVEMCCGASASAAPAAPDSPRADPVKRPSTHAMTKTVFTGMIPPKMAAALRVSTRRVAVRV